MYILALCDKRSYMEIGRHFLYCLQHRKKIDQQFPTASHFSSLTKEWFFMLNTQVWKILRSCFSQFTEPQSLTPGLIQGTSVITLMIRVLPTQTSIQLYNVVNVVKCGRQSGVSVYRIQNNSTGAYKAYMQPLCEFKGSVLILRLIPKH